MYCQKCRLLFEGHSCPSCGKDRHARSPEASDPCFLIERGEPWSSMLADVLKQHGIPAIVSGRMGAGLATRVGSLLESSRFYVRYDDYERANAIVDELFGDDAPR